jgi:flagella basal body P-ring formation protein FlgA
VAVEAGGVGDQIHVLNPVSHISVAALVVGPGEVRVLADDSAIRLAVAP